MSKGKNGLLLLCEGRNLKLMRFTQLEMLLWVALSSHLHQWSLQFLQPPFPSHWTWARNCWESKYFAYLLLWYAILIGISFLKCSWVFVSLKLGMDIFTLAFGDKRVHSFKLYDWYNVLLRSWWRHKKEKIGEKSKTSRTRDKIFNHTLFYRHQRLFFEVRISSPYFLKAILLFFQFSGVCFEKRRWSRESRALPRKYPNQFFNFSLI